MLVSEGKLLAIGVKNVPASKPTGTTKQYEKNLFKLATTTTRANQRQRAQARQ